MKRNIAFFLISILLVTLVLISAGCKTAEQSSPSASAETTAPPETTVPPTTEDDGVFDEKDLLALLDEASEMVSNLESIVIENPNIYVRACTSASASVLGDCYTKEGNQITLTCVKENSDRRHVMNFCVFIHLLTMRYSDAICDWDYDYNSMSALSKFPVLFFCPSYKELGFDTPLDCLKAYESKEFNERDNFFYIWVDDKCAVFEYDVAGLARYDYDSGDYAK